MQVINEKIDGAEGFRDMIDILVNRANAVLKCQVVVTQTGDQYMITLAQSAPSARQTDRLRKSIANMVDDEKIIKVFRMSMMQRIMAIRAWVCLDFQAYVSAYMWYSLDDSPPIRTNPMKALGYFVNDAAILQASVVEADQRIRSQERAFIYSTTDNASHPFGDWRRLLKERFVDFEIPLQDPKFKGYSRIRVQKIR